MITVGLVACGRTKSSSKAAAEDLYLSHLFMLAKRYCQANYDRWYILSAEHGLLEPKTVIEPYDATLKAFTPSARDKWSIRVKNQLMEKTPVDSLFVFHAGGLYAKLLAGHIGHSRLPLKGLGIAEQIKWHLERL